VLLHSVEPSHGHWPSLQKDSKLCCPITRKGQIRSFACEIGLKKAAEQLGIPYFTLQGWKKQKSQHGDRAFVGSGHSYASVEKTPGEIELERENNELRRANEILKDALANLDLQFCVAPLGSMINRPRLQTPSIT